MSLVLQWDADLKQKASFQASIYIILIGAFLLVITALSLYIDLRRTRPQYENLATVIGRSIFQELIVVRRWNAQHGGVYVPVTREFQPNPYLEDVLRDVKTTEGMMLTKINPEHMTRVISELLRKEEGIKIDIHITSLNLVNPANQADPWEENALKKFEEGSREESGIVGSGGSAEFRYMAPLRTEASCLKCHTKQGYKIGDIRGGISVHFPYLPFQKGLDETRKYIYFEHIFFFLVGLAILFLLGKKLMVKISDLQEALLRIKRLEGFLPICSHCKKIRVEGGDAKEQESWVPFERYIQDRTDAEFSHGLCPECLKTFYDFEYKK